MDKIDKILEKVTQTQIDTALIKKDVSINTKDLELHIKRTDLLEERIEQHATHHESQLEEALIPIRWIKTTMKIIAAATAIVALAKTTGVL